MTREELLQELDGIVPKNPKSDWSIYQRKIVNMAIKALEQEPVIDKIREEIEKLPTYEGLITAYEIKQEVLEIIDKYKAERDR